MAQNAEKLKTLNMKHLKVLKSHGVDYKINGSKVIAHTGYYKDGSEWWEDITDLTTSQLYTWLGYDGFFTND